MLALVSACATAGYEGGDDDDDDLIIVDGGGTNPDAATQPRPDASTGGTPDAATGTPVEITLSQSTATSITAANSVACVAEDALMNQIYHRAGSFYRAFTLATHGVTGPLTVSKVTVGIESAAALSGGNQPASIVLHTVAGTFPTGALTTLTTQPFTVTDTTTGTLVDVPLSTVVPAGSTLVVEFALPDGQVAGEGVQGNLIFPGSNDLGQSGASYLTAPDCGATTPQDISTLGFPNMHLVLTVTGTHIP